MPSKKPNNRKNITVRLPGPLIERLKRVARLAAGYPVFASVGSIVEAGVMTELDRVEAVLAATYKNLDDASDVDPPLVRRVGFPTQGRDHQRTP